MYKLEKVWKYYRNHGLKLLWMKLVDKPIEKSMDYMKWREDRKIGQGESDKQLEELIEQNLKISIAVPIFHTPEQFLKEMIKSVQSQSYQNWELCIADGSTDDKAYNVAQEYALFDERIKIKKIGENKGIADNTNVAFAMCTGDYIGLLDHDDFLEADALYEVVKRINEKPNTEVIYTDEDKVSMDGKQFFEPHFKSDFNLELLRANNYICHFFVVKRTILEEVGGLRKEYDGAQDYDFILRCVEKAKIIEHVAKPLYHWRTHQNSTAENPESKLFAYESGKRAIEEHLKRQKEKGEVRYTENWGFYHVKYNMMNPDWVTIIILKKSYSRKKVMKCIRSIRETIGYSNYDILCIDKIQEINTLDIKGEYVLLVDGTISMITRNWMEELLGLCQREKTGAVGIKLYNKNETIKHAGIILGMNGYAFEGFPRVRQGYFHRDDLMQNLNAVTMNL